MKATVEANTPEEAMAVVRSKIKLDKIVPEKKAKNPEDLLDMFHEILGTL